ncbi:hypothetical protein SAMN02927924_01444 [Sphingobium faniae]|nr:hypothetical protein SAMN02927924_01444 [Sphingobium faniae]
MSKEELTIIFIGSMLAAIFGLWRAYAAQKRCDGHRCGRMKP